jgi:hypothetical protein
VNFERTGICFFCLEPIEAVQPGGKYARHSADGTPYGECEQARPAADPFVIELPEVACA